MTFLLKQFIALSLMLLSACAITPDTTTKQTSTSQPTTITPVAENKGGIYKGNGFRPLFEDRRPRYVGDIVTINITENTTATKSNASSASKDAETNTSIGSFFGRPITQATFAANASTSYDDTANANASNNFNGAITATVIEVLPNGFLVVSGEKQIALDKGTEFVRFSGVVNPDTITIGNTVISTRVADARIEYRTNSKVDAAQIASMFARFFLSMGAL